MNNPNNAQKFRRKHNSIPFQRTVNIRWKIFWFYWDVSKIFSEEKMLRFDYFVDSKRIKLHPHVQQQKNFKSGWTRTMEIGRSLLSENFQVWKWLSDSWVRKNGCCFGQDDYVVQCKLRMFEKTAHIDSKRNIQFPQSIQKMPQWTLLYQWNLLKRLKLDGLWRWKVLLNWSIGNWSVLFDL